MDETTLRFDVPGFQGGIESRRVGDFIEITFAGLPGLAFDVNDLVARDATIASLLQVGLKGKTVAALCHTRPSQVSKVRQRVREGGYEALARQPRGRQPKLTGSRRKRAQHLRRQGFTVREIGRELGVSPSCAAGAVRGIPRGGSAAQQGELLEPSELPVEAAQDTPWPEAAAVTDPPAADEVAAADEAPVTDELLLETWAESLVEAERWGEALAESEAVRELEAGGSSQALEGAPSPTSSDEPAPCSSHAEAEELRPGVPLPVGPAAHPCRYAGTLLIGAAVQALGLFRALTAAAVRRPASAVYAAPQALVALVSAWASGLGTLEAMHERDARALGVVLGLERSPSVRTLHRAIAQMVAVFNPIAWGTALLRGLMAAVGQVPQVFGVDGHFKPYFGREPIDKGYDTKRRLAHRGLSDVLIHDEQGRLWAGMEVGAGDKLSEHLLPAAQRLRQDTGVEGPLVLGFDRGGFCLETFEALDREDFYYVGWVPASVKLPDLSTIAPAADGVGEQRFAHPSLSAEHHARLLVQRDGEALLPVLTNLPESVGAATALKWLRQVRGFQENDIKAARSFAQIDRLVDRGQARRAPDDRLVDNPVRVALAQRRRQVRARLAELSQSEPISAQDWARLRGQQLVAELEEALLQHKLSGQKAKVPRVALEPTAQRAWLKTKNRALLQPLKYLLANGRRWLLNALGTALAPSEAVWDQNAVSRTLVALIRAPGTVRFGTEVVEVTLELPLPQTPHARLARGLEDLDRHGLRFTDGERRVVFRLAPRPTRQDLPSAQMAQGSRENSL